jgi:hypothetical protein
MKTFLLKNNTPIVKWSMVPDNTFFEGTVPEGYALAVAPSENYIVLDVDEKNGKSGHSHIPIHIFGELLKTFNYHTKSGGSHYWLQYTGNKTLLNTSTKFGLDLRIGAKKGNAGGYVKYRHHTDIRQCIHLIKETSSDMNIWLESLFQGVKVDNYDRRTS